MTTLLTRKRYTPEDLLSMPDGDHYELVDGELVEKPMGAEASEIAGVLTCLVKGFTRKNRLGWVFDGTCGYQCFPDDPTRIWKPDVSFVRFGRLPEERIPIGHVTIAPDLAIEVISATELFSDVHRKIVEYLRAGVRLVWVVVPGTRWVEVSRADGSVSCIREADELSGEDVLAGFRCPVSELFPPAAEPAPEPAKGAGE